MYDVPGFCVISCSREDDRIMITDVKTGKEILSVNGRRGEGMGSNPVFSPDGNAFATGAAGGTLKIWDAASGKELTTIFRAVRCVAFSPDGKFLVCGCHGEYSPTPEEAPTNGEIKLWDVATGEEVRTFVRRPDQERQGAGARNLPQTLPRGRPDAARLAAERNSAQQAARAQAAQGDWKGADRAYARMFQIQPIDNGEPGFESAAVALLSGDKAGYQQRCTELLERSGTAAIRGYHVARACTLAPNSVEDFAVPAQKSADELRRFRTFWSLTEQGALACRAGRYDEAATLLEDSLEADFRPGTTVLNWLWLALVEWRRDKPAEARAWLAKASTWMDQVSPDGTKMPANVDGLHMHNWLEAMILRMEAEAELHK
jgi:hypothetical protein